MMVTSGSWTGVRSRAADPRGIRLWVYSCELLPALDTYVQSNAVVTYLINSPALATGALSGWLFLMTCPPFSYSFGSTRFCSSSRIFPAPRIPHFSKEPCCLYWRKILGNKTLAPVCSWLLECHRLKASSVDEASVYVHGPIYPPPPLSLSPLIYPAVCLFR